MSLLSRVFSRAPAADAEWIEAETLAQLLSSTAAPILVDVRSPEEFVGPLGHIPGAVNIPLPELPGRLPELLHRPQQLVTVCKTDRRSAAAAGQLRAAGVANVAVLRGGMERWRALNLT